MSKTDTERRTEVQEEMNALMGELKSQSWWIIYHNMPGRKDVPFNQQEALLAQEKYDTAAWQLKGAIERYFDLK